MQRSGGDSAEFSFAQIQARSRRGLDVSNYIHRPVIGPRLQPYIAAATCINGRSRVNIDQVALQNNADFSAMNIGARPQGQRTTRSQLKRRKHIVGCVDASADGQVTRSFNRHACAGDSSTRCRK